MFAGCWSDQNCHSHNRCSFARLRSIGKTNDGVCSQVKTKKTKLTITRLLKKVQRNYLVNTIILYYHLQTEKTPTKKG